jgi:hypothetical protein
VGSQGIAYILKMLFSSYLNIIILEVSMMFHVIILLASQDL